MKKRKYFLKKSGTILIFTLWLLSLLSALALNIAMGVRQKITLLSRLEKRNQLHFIAEAGVKKALGILNTDEGELNSLTKALYHNNKKQFSHIDIQGGYFEVSYPSMKTLDSEEIKFGIVDEDSKININRVNSPVLRRLLQNTVGLSEQEAQEVAVAIVDWRDFGHSEMTGFFSDEYYANLEFPYKPKENDYEMLEELLLVKGVTKEILQKLSLFVTVYGQGQINMNTVSKDVLLALGIEEELVDKILTVRRGDDGIEFTADDFIFERSHDIVSDLKSAIDLTEEQISFLDGLIQRKLFKIQSSYFLIRSIGHLDNADEQRVIRCVYNMEDQKIEYWREK